MNNNEITGSLKVILDIIAFFIRIVLSPIQMIIGGIAYIIGRKVIFLNQKDYILLKEYMKSKKS